MILNQTMIWTPVTLDEYSAPTQGTPKSLPCRYEGTRRQIANAQGQMVQAQVHFWHNEASIKFGDQLTIDGTTYTVIQVGPTVDLSGRIVGREAWC